MTERIPALGNAHPPISAVLNSYLLSGLGEESKLGPEGALRYEGALVRMAQGDSTEEIPEIAEIEAAAAASDPFAVHLLHKIARIEQLSFSAPDDMVREFKNATRPTCATELEYIPGSIFSGWLEDERAIRAEGEVALRRIAEETSELQCLLDIVAGMSDKLFQEVI